MKKNTNKGFTLIEILVVIGIIAILAAIVIIAINPARQFAQARNTQRESNVNAILNAIGQFTADNKGELPNLPPDGDEVDHSLCLDLVPTYLPAMLTDPASDNKGAAVQCSSVTASGDVEYEISTVNSRVEVCAPNAADEDAIDGAKAICITR